VSIHANGAALTQISPEAQDRMAAFLAGRTGKVVNVEEDR
jgi:hypothetical protein